MSHSFEPGPEAIDSELRPLVETDRRDLVAFLERDREENIYLLSRVALDGVVNEVSSAHGRFYGFFEKGVLAGIAFFGHRKGFVLAGDGAAFLHRVADLAQGEESDWVILVGPEAAVTGFLSHYRWRGRATHLNRAQDFFVLRPATLPRLSGQIRPAQRSDLDPVVEMSEQMLCEDFDLSPGSLSRDGIREAMQQKIREGRTWVAEQDGQLVFKVDISAQYADGAQIEGVFTRPDFRGQGIASRAVAALGAELLKSSSFVTLHVDCENLAARRAYEKAGFRPFSSFRLVLLKTV